VVVLSPSKPLDGASNVGELRARLAVAVKLGSVIDDQNAGSG